MPQRTFAVGIDLGGTTIKAGSVDRKGNIIHQIAVASKASKGPQGVIQQLEFAIQDILGRHKISECIGIGIGSPGVVDETGVVKHPPNFKEWSDIPLGSIIR